MCEKFNYRVKLNPEYTLLTLLVQISNIVYNNNPDLSWAQCFGVWVKKITLDK